MAFIEKLRFSFQNIVTLFRQQYRQCLFYIICIGECHRHILNRLLCCQPLGHSHSNEFAGGGFA